MTNITAQEVKARLDAGEKLNLVDVENLMSVLRLTLAVNSCRWVKFRPCKPTKLMT
jgi:hypothetical protein